MSEQKELRIRQLEMPTPIDLAMMVLSLVSVILVIVLAFTKLNPQTHELVLFIDTSICIIFLSNFFIGMFKARDKWFYIKHHWIDFVASIPAVEALRLMRLFQILRVIRLIRVTRSLVIPLLRQRKQTTLASLLLALVLILSLSSILILIVEGGVKGANIQTAQDAIWWTLVTISTVGYGDFYPVTTAGHVVGTLVIVCGVSFFGVISGFMASVFVAPEQQENADEQKKEMRQEVENVLKRMEQNQYRILAELDEVKAELSKLKGGR
ncbi:MAG: potassium channel family protein [Shewanella sp.]|nr:potassium channel family protein [Shewanella sp.]MCF1429531.1 potassium channel family protein [Shewanella sp.]MCF1437606.1 potassium channel family protein [Shewanella sp.]MCF1457715.1 potassium channel family protein [Shewanella sp.]